MIISELLDTIRASEGYIPNSLILKTADSLGGVYKWLNTNNGTALRKEMFVAAEGTGGMEEREVITNIEVMPAV
jgi:hypothetical protein